MSDIAAAKKAEGNTYFAQKKYKEAAQCYSEVGVFFSFLLLTFVYRPLNMIPLTIFSIPTVLWLILPCACGRRLRLMDLLALNVTRNSLRVITELLML